MKSDKKVTHILFVTHKYPPSIGGMQRQSFELIRHTSQLTNTSKIVFNNRYPIWLFLLISLPWTAFKLLINKQITHVHANDGLMALFLSPIMLMSHRHFSVTIHGLDIVYSWSLYRLWIRKVLSRFHAVFVVSEATRQECIARGIPENKVHFIPNAVELNVYTEMDDQFIKNLSAKLNIDLSEKIILTSVGRAIPRKGFVWFSEQVLPHLDDRFVYIIAGPGEKNQVFLKWLKRSVPALLFKRICQLYGVGIDHFILEELALQSKTRINLLRSPSSEELQQLYAHTDIFLMPNLRIEGDFEGFGLVALEAASHNAVVLASDVDGIPSAVKNGENGVLLSSGNADIWKNKILELADNQDQLKKLGAQFGNHTRSTQYSWKEVAERYLDVLSAISSTR